MTKDEQNRDFLFIDDLLLDYDVVIKKTITKNNMIKYIYTSTLFIGVVKNILNISTIIYYNSLLFVKITMLKNNAKTL